MALKYNKLLYGLLIFSICLSTLTGCPGSGDRISPEEEAKISMVGGNICFWVPNTEHYRLSDLSISPREIPPNKRKYIFGADFKIIDGKLCVPPERWSLPEKGQYIARYFLTPISFNEPFRKVTTGFEISNGEVKAISLTNEEVVR
ncbi:putative T6SS immunity periplasmic lipoprotein [Atlantibacter sp.]|uniref:putative T6SS immunity periplasmic lipoprotein n=1 Tax=Atlantibacter sp. TaxID=1903473 RepID=UPI0028B14B69|nr:putative T6SS immunity periplasmic lipoprotein [Atlantibacter sp.]